MSDGYAGYGAVLQMTDITNSTNVTAIANVSRIQGPSTRRGTIEITTMESASTCGEFKSGIVDIGEMTFDLNYAGSTATAKALWLRTMATHTGHIYTLSINDHTNSKSKLACQGFITGVDMGTPHDGKVDQTVTIKFTGVATYTSYGAPV